jgi:adenosylhomocysteine nucleosidase
MLIACATHIEADALIGELQARQVRDHLYRFTGGLIAIHGIGAYMTHQVLEPLFEEDVGEIWNIGFVGALRDDVARDVLHTVATSAKLAYAVGAGSRGLSTSWTHATLPEISLAAQGVRLITTDWPVSTPAEKARLGEAFDIVDMEGYAIASLAQKKGVPCSLYKIVSDFCSETTLAEMRPKRASLASELFSLVRPLLEAHRLGSTFSGARRPL